MRRLVAAVLATAAASVALPVLLATPATAAGCSTPRGVTVVVEYRELGGGTAVSCDAGGGGDVASDQFRAEGHELTYAQRQPGFVCRVDAVPASDPCVNTSPADAYWGLWWSDGRSGRWTYSSVGADALKVPEGGYVAFAWHQGSGDAPAPSTAPAAHPAATASPTRTPSASPTPTTRPTRTPTPSAATQPTRSPTRSPTPSSSPGEVTSAPAATATANGSSPATATPTAVPATTSGPTSPVTSSPTSASTSAPTPSDPTSTAATEQPTSAASTIGDPVDAAAADTDDPDARSGLPAWVVMMVIVLLLGIAGATAVVRRRRS